MKDERGKMKEKRATDYIRRDLEDLTVKDLLEILRSQPDGAGEVMPYNSNAKKLEMLKKELDRYLTVPEPARGKMKDESAVELSQLWHAEAQIQDMLQDQGKLTPETEALFRKHFQAIEDDFNRVSGAKAARGEMRVESAADRFRRNWEDWSANLLEYLLSKPDGERDQMLLELRLEALSLRFDSINRMLKSIVTEIATARGE